MLFTSLEFLIFVIVVFATFFSVPQRARVTVLVAGSVFFLFTFSSAFVLYSMVFVSVNYVISNFIASERASASNRKKAYYAGQIFNIGGLVVFKYLEFIVENFLSVIGNSSTELTIFDRLILPIGISYYTFQGISYLYLIYKAGDQPEKNFMNFSLYVLFFPKILAGPIERHRKFLPQVHRLPPYDYDRVVTGVQLFLWGLFKKVVVGDSLGLVVNRVFENLEFYQGFPLMIVFMIQPLQLYADFSGYTDMALGLSRIFGIEMTNNFRRPFFSQTVGEFWRRWHITLSSWCNDFIYNRLMLKHRKWGKPAVIYSAFITFLVIGIWHGANWTFVVLGLLQGGALTYEFYTKRRRVAWSRKLPAVLYMNVSRLLVYLFFSFSLVFFFSSNLTDAFYFLSHLFTGLSMEYSSFGIQVISRNEFVISLLFGVCVILVDYFTEIGRNPVRWFRNAPLWFRWFAYYFLIVLFFYFLKNQIPFVYVQF